MVDDRDRCEWVIVSTDTGSLGSREQRAVKQLLLLNLYLPIYCSVILFRCQDAELCLVIVSGRF